MSDEANKDLDNSLGVMKQVIAATLNLPENNSVVIAVAVAYFDCVETIKKVIEAGYGNVSIVIEDSWIKSKTYSINELAKPAHRRRRNVKIID